MDPSLNISKPPLAPLPALLAATIRLRCASGGGWRTFAIAHKLLEGDYVVFEKKSDTVLKTFLFRWDRSGGRMEAVKKRSTGEAEAVKKGSTGEADPVMHRVLVVLGHNAMVTVHNVCTSNRQMPLSHGQGEPVFACRASRNNPCAAHTHLLVLSTGLLTMRGVRSLFLRNPI